MRPSFSRPSPSSRARSSGRSLSTTRLQRVDVGDERLAARLDVVGRDGGDPALSIGVVQRAVDPDEAGQPLAQLVEPDVAQRLRVVLGRARVLHLRRHAADRHAARQQRQQRVAHRVVAHGRLGHRDGVRIGNHHRRVVAEHLLAAVDVVPPADVRADQVLAQHPHDHFLLQRVLGALVQHLDLQRAAAQRPSPPRAASAASRRAALPATSRSSARSSRCPSRCAAARRSC